MNPSVGPTFSAVHTSIEWAARLEGITRHHARRRARAGKYAGAFRRDGDGRWLIPLSSITRTLDGTIRHHLDTCAADLPNW